jgi:hypothetical protein
MGRVAPSVRLDSLPRPVDLRGQVVDRQVGADGLDSRAGKPLSPNVKHQLGPACQESTGTTHTITYLWCRIWLYEIKAPPPATRTCLSSSSDSPARSVRTRSLRAAWRPCSRGPARRAR